MASLSTNHGSKHLRLAKSGELTTYFANEVEAFNILNYGPGQTVLIAYLKGDEGRQFSCAFYRSQADVLDWIEQQNIDAWHGLPVYGLGREGLTVDNIIATLHVTE